MMTGKEIQSLISGYSEAKYLQAKKDWDYKLHDIFDEEIRPNDRIMLQDISEDENGNIKPAEFKIAKVNRIPFALEQDIVNIHTSFAVGQDPKLNAIAKDEKEKSLLKAIEETDRACRISNINKSVVRSYLSETMVAEYWYSVDDADFYNNIGISGGNGKRLKVAIFSPFRGDRLIPEFDEYGSLFRFHRFYKIRREEDGKMRIVDRLQTFTKRSVEIYEQIDGDWQIVEESLHGFDKIPIIFMEREESLTAPIRSIRNRLEFLASNYADCVDYNFAPKLLMRGEVSGVGLSGRTQMIELEGEGADVRYLTWQQSPEMVKLEMDNLIDRAYSLTNTPMISLKNMQGIGNAFSGESFRYMFMGVHMAIRNHEEQIGEYLARRYSFLIHALTLHIPSLETAKLLEIYPELQPYTLDSLSDKVDVATTLYGAGLINQNAALRYTELFDPETDKGEDKSKSLF